MNIYYFVEPIGVAPIYDYVRSKQLYMWEHDYMEWRRGVSPPRPKKNSFTFMCDRLNIGPFKYQHFLDTLSLAHTHRKKDKGYFQVFLYTNHIWQREWKSEWGREPPKPIMDNILAFGLCHDLRYPLWASRGDESRYLPDEIMDLLPKTVR